MNAKVEALKGRLIVSCQALPNEPLHSSFIMGRMALAAKMAGARGIRANTKEDIAEIQRIVDLPIIGIVKRDYEDSGIYITPTMREIDEPDGGEAGDYRAGCDRPAPPGRKDAG